MGEALPEGDPFQRQGYAEDRQGFGALGDVAVDLPGRGLRVGAVQAFQLPDGPQAQGDARLVPFQIHLHRGAHLAVPAHPVPAGEAHFRPGDADPTAVGQIGEGLGGVEVIVAAEQPADLLHGLEAVRGHAPHQVAVVGAGEDPVPLPVQGQRVQIRALVVALQRDALQLPPGEQVVRAVDDVGLLHQIHRAEVAGQLLAPDDLGVPVGFGSVGDDGVVRVFMEGHAVRGVGQPLVIFPVRMILEGGGGIEQHQGMIPQPGDVARIHDGGAGEDRVHALSVLHIRVQGDGQLLPVQQVRAHRVAPVHVAPAVPGGVVLEEKMVVPLVPHQPVGIVVPALQGGEVHLGPQGLFVGVRDGIGEPEARGKVRIIRFVVQREADVLVQERIHGDIGLIFGRDGVIVQCQQPGRRALLGDAEPVGLGVVVDGYSQEAFRFHGAIVLSVWNGESGPAARRATGPFCVTGRRGSRGR